MGVPKVTPKTPKFVILNVDPDNSSGFIFPSRVLLAISFTERQKPRKFFFAIENRWHH